MKKIFALFALALPLMGSTLESIVVEEGKRRAEIERIQSSDAGELKKCASEIEFQRQIVPVVSSSELDLTATASCDFPDSDQEKKTHGPQTTVHKPVRQGAVIDGFSLSPPPFNIEFSQNGCIFLSETDGTLTNSLSCCLLMWDQSALKGIAAYDAASMNFTQFCTLEHMQVIPLKDSGGRLSLKRVLALPEISFYFPRENLSNLPPFVLIETAFCFAQAGILHHGFYPFPVSSLNFQTRTKTIPCLPQAMVTLPKRLIEEVFQMPATIDVGFKSDGCFLVLPNGTHISALSCNILTKGSVEVRGGIYGYEARTKTFIPIFDREKRISFETMIGLNWEALYFPRENYSSLPTNVLLNASICLAQGRVLDQGLHIFPLVL